MKREKSASVIHHKKNLKITVRPPKESELVAVNRLFNEVKDELEFYSNLVKREEGKRFTIAKLTRFLKEDKHSVLVAIGEDGNMLGINFNFYDPKSGTTWTEWTCVRKEYRNRGVGNALRRAMLNATKRRGYGLVVLAEVDPTNKLSAMGLEKLGFRLVTTNVKRFWYSDKALIYMHRIGSPPRSSRSAHN